MYIKQYNIAKILFCIFLILSATPLTACARLLHLKSEDENQFISAKNQKKPVSLPEGTRLLKDLTYGSDPEQKLDIYLPKKQHLQKKAPIIFMVHGGAWMLGDKSYFPVVQNKINRWLKKGIIFVSINYRMSFNPNPLQQVDDVDLALNYIISHIQIHGGDPDKIVLIGHSAGAHLVSLYSSNERFLKINSKIKWLGTISLDSAAFDLVNTMENKHYRFYDRIFGTDIKFWKSNSSYHQIEKKIFPMLIVCSKNRSDACPQAEAFMKKATSLSSKVTVLPVDLKHGEINLNLGLEDKYTEDVEKFLQEIGLQVI